MILGQKFWKKDKNCNSYMDLWKCGQILTIQKSLTIKRLGFLEKNIPCMSLSSSITLYIESQW